MKTNVLPVVKLFIQKDLIPVHQPWNEIKSRGNNLDFLRALFAVVVILSHSFFLVDGNNSREPFWILSHGQMTGGTLAVAFFFIISGYLITQSWMNGPQLLAFFRKRILRIYPAFIVVSLLCVLLVASLGSPHPGTILASFSPVRFLINSVFLYLPGMDGVFVNNPVPGAVNGSAWTIKYEFICYVLIALLGTIGILRRRNIILGLFGISLLTYGLQLGGILSISDLSGQGKIGLIFGSWTYYPQFFSLFFAGTIFYLFRDRIPFSKIYFTVSILLLLVIFMFSNWIALAIPFVATYIILYLGFHPFIRLNSFARHGDFSYGLYLFAYPIQQLLIQYGGTHINSFNLFPIAFGCTLVLAFLSWNIIEKPALKLKRMPVVSESINRKSNPSAGNLDPTASINQPNITSKNP